MIYQMMKAACMEFLEYDTPKIVHIKSRTAGIINRFLEFSILTYIVYTGIIIEKGYQEFDDVKSSVSTKVKGIIFQNTSDYMLIDDPVDYIYPPQETNAFFVTTGFIGTRDQTKTSCPESPYVKEALCDDDAYCETKSNVIPQDGNGPFTGKCVQSDFPVNQTVCEIWGWCPVEDDSPQWMTTFDGAENVTVLIKNNIAFAKFGLRKRNIMDWYASNSELKKCLWNSTDPRDQYCPIFKLADIARSGGFDISKLIHEGGIVKIIINWDCNLDYDEKFCLPQYSFECLDKGNYSSAVGFNFRYAHYFDVKDDNGDLVYTRILYKVTGVHFLIEVRGRAGKFHFVTLMFNVGSGIALMGIACVLTDIVVLNFMKARRVYKESKFEVVNADAYKKLNEDTNAVHKEGSKHGVSNTGINDSMEGTVTT